MAKANVISGRPRNGILVNVVRMIDRLCVIVLIPGNRKAKGEQVMGHERRTGMPLWRRKTSVPVQVVQQAGVRLRATTPGNAKTRRLSSGLLRDKGSCTTCSDLLNCHHSSHSRAKRRTAPRNREDSRTPGDKMRQRYGACAWPACIVQRKLYDARHGWTDRGAESVTDAVGAQLWRSHGRSTPAAQPKTNSS